MLGWRRNDGRARARRSIRRAHARVATVLVLAAGLTVTLEAVAAIARPVNNLAPEVVGNASVGERIVCAAGSWSGTVSEFRYRWLRDGIPFATGVAYQISAADRGHTLWCAVTATGFEGTGEAESSNS